MNPAAAIESNGARRLVLIFCTFLPISGLFSGCPPLSDFTSANRSTLSSTSISSLSALGPSQIQGADLGGLSAAYLQYSPLSYPVSGALDQSFSFHRMKKSGNLGSERAAWLAGLATNSSEFRTFGRIYTPPSQLSLSAQQTVTTGWSPVGPEFGILDNPALAPQVLTGALGLSSSGDLLATFAGGEVADNFQSAVFGPGNAFGLYAGGIFGIVPGTPAPIDSYPTRTSLTAGSGQAQDLAWDTSGHAFLAYSSNSPLLELYVHRFSAWLGWDAGASTAIGKQAEEVQMMSDGTGVTALWRTNFTASNSVSVGGNFSCALNSGTVRCWGSNSSGQLGQSTACTNATDVLTGSSAIAREVKCLAGSEVLQLAAGKNHACAILNTPSAANPITVACWGNNTYGQLGDGTVVSKARPVAVTGVNFAVYTPTQVAAGDKHSCMIANNGVTDHVFCWGDNSESQLGTGASGAPSMTAVQVQMAGPTPLVHRAMSTGFSQIKAGSEYSCVIDGNSGDTAFGVMCWGKNDGSQSGQNSVTATIDVATDIGSPTYDFTSAQLFPVELATGGLHGCVRVQQTVAPNSIAVYCWGTNYNGQLGVSATTTPISINPVAAYIPQGALAISAGLAHTCSIDAGGLVYCWGWDGQKQLGLGLASGSLTTNETPTLVSGITGVTSIGLGQEHTCALDNKQAVFCWGDDASYQLGQNQPAGVDSAFPVSINQPFDCASGKCLFAAWSQDSNFGNRILLGENVRAFGADADTNGNIVIVMLRDNPFLSAASCNSATPNCQVRAYSAYRASSGTWYTPGQVDGEMTATLTTYYQPSGTSGGTDYAKPSVAFLGGSKFAVALASIDVTNPINRLGSVQIRNFQLGGGWSPTPTLLDSTVLGGIPTDVFRPTNAVKLLSDGNGKALLLTHAVVSLYDSLLSAYVSPYGGFYDHEIWSYDGTLWSFGTRTTSLGVPGCDVTQDSCGMSQIEGALFQTGEAVVTFPGPPLDLLPSADSLRLYSLEFKLEGAL